MRHPFLWRPLVEFLLRLPPRQKLRGTLNKYIHRQALADHLPREVLQRPDKADFTVTFARHIPSLLHYIRQSEATIANFWVPLENLEKLGRDAQRPTYGGWPQFMLWTIFGCSCLKTLEKDLTKR